MKSKIKKTLKMTLSLFKKRKYTLLISKSEALKALKSVNREAKSAFTFFKRPQKSSKLIDQLEEKWWNSTGDFIEDIWGLPDELCLAYRQEYVLRAKKSFLEDKENVKILDLGCGTGWFGRIIADKNVFYHGIDFSDKQIQIAQQKAKGKQNESFLRYTKTTNIKHIENINDFDGIIINAFLHHLCKNELIALFDEIKLNFKSGTKIFVMEPTYPTNKVKSNITTIDHIKADMVMNIISRVKKYSIENQNFDTEKEQKLQDLITESNENGFFFSPKEVPFTFEEIEELLSKYTQMKQYFHLGVNDFSFLQMLSFVKDENFRKGMLQEIFPILKQIDEQLIEKSYYFNGTNNYIFTCFVCVLK